MGSVCSLPGKPARCPRVSQRIGNLKSHFTLTLKITFGLVDGSTLRNPEASNHVDVNLLSGILVDAVV
jgi:hypothetical protein